MSGKLSTLVWLLTRTNWLIIAVGYSASALRLGKENPTHGLIPTYLLQWGALYVYRGQTTMEFGISPKRKRVWESSQGQLLKYRSKMLNFEATTTISELFFWASSVSKYFIIKINASFSFIFLILFNHFFDFQVWGGGGVHTHLPLLDPPLMYCQDRWTNPLKNCT